MNIARTTSSSSTKSEVKDVNVDEKSTVGTEGFFCGLWKADQLKPPQRP